MPAPYPSLPFSYDSEIRPISKVIIDRAEDGTGRGRMFHATDKYQLTIKHSRLTQSEKITLDLFYGENRGLAVSLTDWMGVVRTIIISTPPSYRVFPGNYYDAVLIAEDV